MLFMVAVYNLSITRLGPLKAIIRIDGGIRENFKAVCAEKTRVPLLL